MSATLERVRKITAEHLGVDPSKVVENAGFITDLGGDSLDTVELTMAFEDEFGVDLPTEEAENLLTVGEMVKLIDAKLQS